jgi:hypothetical protein
MDSNDEVYKNLSDLFDRLDQLFENVKQQLAFLSEDQFPVFTGDQIMKRLGITKEKLSQFHKQGLEHVKIGHITLHTREDLLKFYDKNKI